MWRLTLRWLDIYKKLAGLQQSTVHGDLMDYRTNGLDLMKMLLTCILTPGITVSLTSAFPLDTIAHLDEN